MSRPTAKEKIYMGKVAELGCCICSQAAEIHHQLSGEGMGQRASNYKIMPLCPSHHRNGGYKVAIHAGIKAWEELYGSEVEWIQWTQEQVNGV